MKNKLSPQTDTLGHFRPSLYTEHNDTQYLNSKALIRICFIPDMLFPAYFQHC